MFHRKETYIIDPNKTDEFHHVFSAFILPNHIKNGANLIGHWFTESKDEVLVIWEYPSYEEYLKIDQRVKRDHMHVQALNQLNRFGEPCVVEVREDFLTSATAEHEHQQKQTVTVSGYITNDIGEVLLVRTYWRSDTWELPGGGVDDGETLDAALCREILEETGIMVQLFGVSGVYSNGNVVAIVFRGRCIEGKVQTSSETKDVRFVKLDSENVSQYIKRKKFIPRVLDAMGGNVIPYEAFKVRPYELLRRIDKSF